MKDEEEKFTSLMLNMATRCHLWLEEWIKFNLERIQSEMTPAILLEPEDRILTYF